MSNVQITSPTFTTSPSLTFTVNNLDPVSVETKSFDVLVLITPVSLTLLAMFLFSISTTSIFLLLSVLGLK